MRLNRLEIACVALLVVSLFTRLIVMRLFLQRPGVTPANIQRLYKGMYEKDVEAVMGRPRDGGFRVTGSHFSYWRESDCSVIIKFGDWWIDGKDPGATDGGVSFKGGGKLELREETAIDFFRYLVGL